MLCFVLPTPELTLTDLFMKALFNPVLAVNDKGNE